jgi:hypothetical protein
MSRSEYLTGRAALEQIQSATPKSTGPDAGLPTVNYNPSDPSQTGSDIARFEQARYERDYQPVEDRAIASLRDTSIIDDARARTGNQSTLDRARQRAERDRARYGFRQSEASSQSAEVNAALGQATGDANTMNNARINQFDRNRGFRNELINIGRGVSEQAQQGLANAGAMQTQRDNANRAASAQASAGRTQMAGSMAAMALMMFV